MFCFPHNSETFAELSHRWTAYLMSKIMEKVRLDAAIQRNLHSFAIVPIFWSSNPLLSD